MPRFPGHRPSRISLSKMRHSSAVLVPVLRSRVKTRLSAALPRDTAAGGDSERSRRAWRWWSAFTKLLHYSRREDPQPRTRLMQRIHGADTVSHLGGGSQPRTRFVQRVRGADVFPEGARRTPHVAILVDLGGRITTRQERTEDRMNKRTTRRTDREQRDDFAPRFGTLDVTVHLHVDTSPPRTLEPHLNFRVGTNKVAYDHAPQLDTTTMECGS